MNKKTFEIFIISFFLSSVSFGQANQYIIVLKDKANSPYSIAKPEEFLSARAIARRERQNITIVENDLPVNPNYIDSIRLSGNVTIKNTSKWLNQVLIETTDPDALQKINDFSFVKSAQPSRRAGNIIRERKKFEEPQESQPLLRKFQVDGSVDYGVSEAQVKIHKGDFLHDKGFTGSGMLIAIIDDGFYHYKTLPAFDSIRLNNRILDTWDFVDDKADMNDEDTHGMYCLSLMAANVPGQMVGTAPGASYLLYRSEDIHGEYPGEEQNWVAAAERSDSAGADIVTTSLGYNTFDNPAFDYTYQDMDGKTTIMARAASVAASKGMILMMAAGNEGAKPWHYITTPSDAINVLTVGAVNVAGNPGAFSSFGPTPDGRIKPEVSSVGVAAFVQGANGSFSSGNGTSFATPNLAGLVTCLWQAFQDFTSAEIMEAAIKSSSKYANPDNAQMGYGIPDFEIAYNALIEIRNARNQGNLNNTLAGESVLVYPNPVNELATILFKPTSSGNGTIKLFDGLGRLCYSATTNFTKDFIIDIPFNRNGLQRGIYFLQIINDKRKFVKKIVIQ